MKRMFAVMSLFFLLCPCLPAVPGLISYQGMLRDDGGHSITTATDLTFTFWDQETGGSPLGGGFSDTDTVIPNANGLFTTLIGDAPTSPVPEAIFSVDDVWLNVNAGGVDLSPRTRITSVGFAIHASSAETAASASGMSPVLNQPGDRFNLGNGTWYEVGPDGRTYLYVNGRRHGSMQWLHPQDLHDYISPSGPDALNPKVAMDDNGDAILVWQQSDGTKSQIFKSEYRDGVWVHPSSLSDNISPDVENAQNPLVVMDNNGNAIIVWRQSDGAKIQIFKSEYRNGAWTHPSSLSDNISPDGQDVENPDAAMDDNGNAIIVWQQQDGTNKQIFMSEFRANVWNHPDDLNDNISPGGQHAVYPKVAINKGNAIIVWHQLDGSKLQVFMSEFRMRTWTHPRKLTDNISPDGEHAQWPQAAMDNNGNALIAWEQEDGANFQIFKSEYRKGAWIHPIHLSSNISPDGQGAIHARVAMDNNGSAIIIWQQSDGVKYQIFKSEYRNDAWTHPWSLSDNISPDGQDAQEQQVVLDDDGNAIIVLQSSAMIFKSEYRKGAWIHPSGVADSISPAGANASTPQAAMSNDGNAIITWSQSDGAINRIYMSEYCWDF